MLLNTANGRKSMEYSTSGPRRIPDRRSSCPRPTYSSGAVDEGECATAANDGGQDLEHLWVQKRANLGGQEIDRCLGRECPPVRARGRQRIERVGRAENTPPSEIASP